MSFRPAGDTQQDPGSKEKTRYKGTTKNNTQSMLSVGSCAKLGQSLKMRRKRAARSLAGLLGPKEERETIPWRNRLETEF